MYVPRYKIKKIKKFAFSLRPQCTAKNFKIEKNITDHKEINYLLNKTLYPFSFDFKNNMLYFVETDTEIKHNEVSFFWEKLQIRAKYIIPVRIDDFYELIKDFSKVNQKNILFIHHVGRCGSTLLHKLLGSHEQVESFSEELWWDNVFINQDVNFAEKERMCMALLALIAKKWIGKTYKLLVFKMTGGSRYYFNSLGKVLPQSKHIYLSRNPLEVCESIVSFISNVSLGFRLKTQCLVFFNIRLIPSRRKKELAILGGANSPVRQPLILEKLRQIRNFNMLEYFVLNVMLSDKAFRLIKAKKENLILLDYSDLTDIKRLIALLVEFTDIDAQYAFNELLSGSYSQEDSIIDMSKRKKNILSDKHKQKLQAFKEYAEEILEK